MLIYKKWPRNGNKKTKISIAKYISDNRLMANKIIEYANKFVNLTEEEAKQFSNAFKEVKIKKRQFIVQPNFTAKHRHYVLKGALMAYVVGDDGQNHTITFAIEDWWITDYNSYIFQQPAR